MGCPSQSFIIGDGTHAVRWRCLQGSGRGDSFGPAQRRVFRDSLLLPIGSFLPLTPSLIELHKPFAGAVQVIPIRYAYEVFPGQHSLIAFEQQRLSFRVLPLTCQTGAEEAFRAESLPVTGLFLAVELEGFARKGFGLDELLLRYIGVNVEAEKRSV